MLEVKRKPAVHSHGATASAPARIRTSESNDKTGRTSVSQIHSVTSSPRNDPADFRGKIPVIIGECHFKGSMSLDGLVSGQIGAQNGVSLKQRPSSAFAVDAELAGEFSFKGMLRINGHIAGTVYSEAGTIIVDAEAKVDADVDVAVAVIGGTVNGDIVARERVELGPASRIYGNIWTRSIVIKDGAIFEGVCHMIADTKQAV
jgi:cytoskeletal protein CcmA (bactofilin family)